MKPTRRGTVTRVEVLDAISDDISLNLLNVIINEAGNAGSLRDQLQLSQREYYARMVKLVDTGLVKRKGRAYTITSFGRLIYQVQLKIAKAQKNLSKLKMADIVRDSDISKDEYREFIDKLIDDNEIKNIIFTQMRNEPS
jgi:predicted transcriptional regulator